MLVRYSGSIGPALFITAALMYWMQFLIGDADIELPPAHPRILQPASTVILPPVPTRPTPPERPTSRTRPPSTTLITDHLTTVPVGPVGPATPPGPPRPQAPPGGRQGLPTTDASLTLLSQGPPIYPYQALIRELEGFVIVEFTVTRSGAVSDARVVESTHEEFESAALAAVRRSRYRPPTLGGAPVEVRGLRTQIQFRLED